MNKVDVFPNYYFPLIILLHRYRLLNRESRPAMRATPLLFIRLPRKYQFLELALIF